MWITSHAKKYALIFLIWGMEFGASQSLQRYIESQSADPEVVIVTANQPPDQDEGIQVSPPTDVESNAIAAFDLQGIAFPPFDHHECMADLNINVDIRQKIFDSKMSVQTQDIRIITQNGVVTLRGTVPAEEVKEHIGDLAAKVIGPYPYDIDNQLEVTDP